MNVNDIKSFLSGTNLLKAGQNDAAKAYTLNDAAAKTAVKDTPAAMTHIDMTKMSSIRLGAASVNYHVFNRLEQSDKQEGIENSNKSDVESLFDFDTVIKNVLEFVSNAVHARKDAGASEEDLKEMMAQARKGVDMGFSDARKELEDANEMNDELEQGIQKAYDGIQVGLDDLDKELFGAKEENLGVSRSYYQELSAEKAVESSLTLQTADGDKVTISFSQLTSYQQQLLAQQQAKDEADDATENSVTATQRANASVIEQFAAATSGIDENGVLGDTDLSFSQVIEASQQSSYQQTGDQSLSVSEESQFYQAINFSFSVEGELDADELKAIGDLVQDISGLVDEFVNGNPDEAFEKALNLGYDDEQIASFSYQYTQVERYRSTQIYEEVNRMADSPAAALQEQIVPIAKYSGHLLALVEASKLRLESGEGLSSLMDEVAKQQLEQVDKGAELQDRFAKFNQRLLSALPNQKAN